MGVQKYEFSVQFDRIRSFSNIRLRGLFASLF